MAFPLDKDCNCAPSGILPGCNCNSPIELINGLTGPMGPQGLSGANGIIILDNTTGSVKLVNTANNPDVIYSYVVDNTPIVQLPNDGDFLHIRVGILFANLDTVGCNFSFSLLADTTPIVDDIRSYAQNGLGSYIQEHLYDCYLTRISAGEYKLWKSELYAGFAFDPFYPVNASSGKMKFAQSNTLNFANDFTLYFKVAKYDVAGALRAFIDQEAQLTFSIIEKHLK